MSSLPPRPRSRDDFQVAVVCALPFEANFVDAIFDHSWSRAGVSVGQAFGDCNVYTTGIIGTHNVVMAHMPIIGENSAASVSARIPTSFPRVEVVFVVGICGVSPIHPETGAEIILGDCILSTTIIQYDFGRQFPNNFIRKQTPEDTLIQASSTTKSLMNMLQVSRNLVELTKHLRHYLEILQSKDSKVRHEAQYPGADADRLFETSHLHVRPGINSMCESCLKRADSYTEDCGTLRCSKMIGRKRLTEAAILAGENKPDRDRLVNTDKITAFEMEGAGAGHNLPVILIKSASDYADSHKNSKWQLYAAATAAASFKAVLEYWPITERTKFHSQITLNVPDRLVAKFVSRHDMQEELDEWVSNSAQRERMVLLGMGGAGKSQLALACCRKVVQDGQCPTVFWINAASMSSVERSLKIIVSGLDETASSNFKENLALLTQALRRRDSPWFAVYDNYDTPDAFDHGSITDYIPKAEHGKVLFTSRHTGSERLGRTIRVSGMSKCESLELLLGPTSNMTDHVIALQIAAKLGHLALALDQAGAYIRARNLLLQEFFNHFERRKKMVLQEVPDLWEYRRNLESEQDVVLSAYTTWELSYEQMSGDDETKQKKGHFLTLCAFFDPSSISKEYFESYCKRGLAEWTTLFKSESESDWDEFLFDDLVAECRKLSLFQSTGRGDRSQGSISLHPLVRDWLTLRKTEKEYEKIANNFIDIVAFHLDTINCNVQLGFAKRQQLLANIDLALKEDIVFQNLVDCTTGPAYVLSCARNFGIAFRISGLYRESRGLLEQVLTGQRDRLGARRADTLRIIRALSMVYTCNKDRYDEAEEIVKQVLAQRQIQLGTKHRLTLRIMHILSIFYTCNKDRYNEAEKLAEQVLLERRGELGARHPQTLCIMHTLGFIYTCKRSYDKAEETLKQVLAEQQDQPLGDKYSGTPHVMHILGIVYTCKGRYNEAKELLQQASLAYRDQPGAKNPDALFIKQAFQACCTDEESHLML